MQVFGFDLVAYPEHFDHLKVNGELGRVDELSLSYCLI
jgi:hypothetical protein